MTKNCKICGCTMVSEYSNIPVRYWESSCNIENWPICHDCMVEHCTGINCYACKYGKYPECRFLDMKKHYIEKD